MCMKFTRRISAPGNQRKLPLPPCFPSAIWVQASEACELGDYHNRRRRRQSGADAGITFEAYASEKSDWVSKFAFTKASRPPSFPARSRRSRRPARSISIWC